jgi:hypothetical protein
MHGCCATVAPDFFGQDALQLRADLDQLLTDDSTEMYLRIAARGDKRFGYGLTIWSAIDWWIPDL